MINQTYDTDFSILTESEFYSSSFKENYENDYQIYLSSIIDLDIDDLKNDLIENIDFNLNEKIDVEVNHSLRSSLGSKNVSFFDSNNKMTLKYKYSSGKFDTGYKPTATVTKVNTNVYFDMSSYTGSFKNSNKSYSVVAKGREITLTGIVSGKSYTVTFNL